MTMIILAVPIQLLSFLPKHISSVRRDDQVKQTEADGLSNYHGPNRFRIFCQGNSTGKDVPPTLSPERFQEVLPQCLQSPSLSMRWITSYPRSFCPGLLIFSIADPVWYGRVRVLCIYIPIHWRDDGHRWTSLDIHVNRPSTYQPSVTHSLSLLGVCFSWLKLWSVCSTLIDSTPGVYKAWKTFAADYALGDYREITHATHGRRLYDTLRELCKINDDTKLLVNRNC